METITTKQPLLQQMRRDYREMKPVKFMFDTYEKNYKDTLLDLDFQRNVFEQVQVKFN